MILSKENIEVIDIDFVINLKIQNGKSNELLLIVPTNRKARNVKKEIISRNPNHAVFGMNIETLGTLSGRLLSEITPFKKLSEAASIIFIKQCSKEINLKYFSMYRDEIPFGTLDKIKNVISEYKRHGISPEHLRREAEKLEKSELNKALDVANIYELFMKKCESLSAFEIGDVYRELNLVHGNLFKEKFKSLFPEVDLIVLNGFSEFTDPEIDIIKKLSTVKNTKTYILFDYFINNDQLFSHLDKCYAKLEKTGFKKIKDGSANELNKFTQALRSNLFNSVKLKNKIDSQNRLFIIEGYDREKEVELIAKEIKTLILNEKTEPHNISVVFNQIQNYSPIIKDVFEKNGIPFNLTDRTPLDNSNPVTGLVNFLEVAENNYFYKNIFRALSSRFIDIAEIDVGNLYKLAAELNIVAGKQNWIDSLGDAISNIVHAGDSDDDLDDKRKKVLKALNDIKNISRLLKPFDEKLTISDFEKYLQNLIVELKLPFKLLEIQIDQEKNVRAFTEFLETLSEVFGLLKKEKGESQKFPLGFFMDQIRTASGWARFNEKEKSNYGVQITNLEEIRGLNFDYVFIGGLCDGDLPTRYNPEIFFSGSFRKKAFTHQLEERYRFYQALCSWNKRLYVSFHLTEDGKEKITSTFLKDMQSVFTFTEITDENYENQIYSAEELQIFIGKQGVEHAASFKTEIDDIDLSKISRALEIENTRLTDPLGDSPFTGNILSESKTVGDKNKKNELSDQLSSLASKQYSISQLETYAKCPFKFFMERVLGIETIEEPTEDIEAIEMGRLLHSILFEFYSTIRDKKIKLAGCDEKTLTEAENLIFKIAEEQIQTTAFKSPLTFYEKEKILGLNSNRKQSILYKFLEVERKCEDEFLPLFFEVSFGKIKESDSDKLLSDRAPINIDQVKLRGKIDRVEVNEKLEAFNIVDYKLSGAKPSFDDLKNGLSLQLPVYLFAAAELLSKKFNRKYSPNEMFIYSLKYAIDEFGKDKINLGKRKDEEISSVDQLISKTIEHIKLYVQEIFSGKFGLSPHDEREKIVCRYCQFRKVCRIDELN